MPAFFDSLRERRRIALAASAFFFFFCSCTSPPTPHQETGRIIPLISAGCRLLCLFCARSCFHRLRFLHSLHKRQPRRCFLIAGAPHGSRFFAPAEARASVWSRCMYVASLLSLSRLEFFSALFAFVARARLRGKRSFCSRQGKKCVRARRVIRRGIQGRRRSRRSASCLAYVLAIQSRLELLRAALTDGRTCRSCRGEAQALSWR